MEGLYIRLNPKRERISISRQCIAGIDYPKRIRLLINPEKKLIAMQPCNNKERMFFKVPKDIFESSREFTISSQSLLLQIWEIMKWKPFETYALSGTLVENKVTVFFDMNDAQIATINFGGNSDG